MKVQLPIAEGRAIAEEETLQLRDVFAAFAIVGYLARAAPDGKGDAGVAEWAYQTADDMLRIKAARGGTG